MQQLEAEREGPMKMILMPVVLWAAPFILAPLYVACEQIGKWLQERETLRDVLQHILTYWRDKFGS